MAAQSFVRHIYWQESIYQQSWANAGTACQAIFNVKPLLHMIFGLLILSSFYAIVFCLSTGPTGMELANATLPLFLMLALFITAIRLILDNNLMIWTPITWLLLSSSLYYGLGPLVYHYGNEETVERCDLYYSVDEPALLRVNMLDSIGISLILIGFLLGWSFMAQKRFNRIPSFRNKSIRSVAVLFLAIGLPIKFFLSLPHVLGMTDSVLPHSIAQVANLSFLAIVPLMVLVHRGEKKFRMPLYGLIATEIFFSLIEFSKLSFLMILIIVIMALFFCYKRLAILAVGLSTVLLVYAILVPMILFARTELTKIDKPEIYDRINLVERYFTTEAEESITKLGGQQTWWVRLNCVPAQNFVLDQYDSGLPGDSLNLIFYVIVPRILVPDKPTFSELGRKFNFIVNGNPDNSSSPGFVGAESYWNGGYLIAIIVCLFMGLLFAIITNYSLLRMGQHNFLYLPVVFLGIRMGLRPDSWILTEIIGPLVVLVLLHYVLKHIRQFWLST